MWPPLTIGLVFTETPIYYWNTYQKWNLSHTKSHVDFYYFLSNYTGSRLQRVRLLRAPGYNKQIFFSKTNPSHLRQCSKSSDTTSTSYNEHIFMN